MVMSRLKLFVATVMAILPLLAVANTTPMRQVRDMAREKGVVVVDNNLCIEGYIISKPNGNNNDLNIQAHYTGMRNDDLATLYVESLSGDVGLRVKLKSRNMAKQFPRYARVVLSLQGTTLRFAEPCCVTIEGLSDSNIVELTKCDESALPRKTKYIGEITDDDIYTYVTLKDCELVFKDGAFSNVCEQHVLQSSVNKKIKPNKSMDTWATLLCDKRGSHIYSMINSLCAWRRDGEGVPQGAGDMRGIVANVSYLRYGGDVLGRYVLFPADKEDFAMNWAAKSSSYKSIAEWNWNDNEKALLTDSGYAEVVTTEKVKADVGKGLLKIVAGGEARRGKDTNNPYVATPKEKNEKGSKGLVNYGALQIKNKANNWWDWKNDCGKGVEVEFSTKGLKGQHILFGFTFAAGKLTAATSYGFPVCWNVEYSIDGKEWHKVEGSAPKKLRALPWPWYDKANGLAYDSISSGVGYTEHMVILPKSLFGKSKVYVRVVPVAKIAATLGYDNIENGALRHNSMVETIVNFGSFVVRYN